jgi:phosphate transport system ATP-binding protein
MQSPVTAAGQQNTATTQPPVVPIGVSPAPTSETAVDSTPHLSVRDLSAFYGRRQAIHEVTFDIPKQRVLAIIGPSGCGKSTLIRCFNRMHEVVPGARTEGDILCDGENIYDPSIDPVQLRRKIGMVFQRPNPFPTMSVADNVVAGVKLGTHGGRHALADIVEQTLRRAALWDEVKDKLKEPGISL